MKGSDMKYEIEGRKKFDLLCRATTDSVELANKLMYAIFDFEEVEFCQVMVLDEHGQIKEVWTVAE